MTQDQVPDDLSKRTKAAAAMREISLKDLVTKALQEYQWRQAASGSAKRGWRSVFGKARPEEVETVDAVVAVELERVDPGEWR